MTERKIWLALAAAFAAGGVIQLPWAPSRFGGVFFLALAVGCAGEWLMLRLRDRYKVCRVLSVVGRVLFGLFLVSFIAIQGIILHGMRADPEAADAEYLLVLGARVYEDGRPSAALAARLDTAYDFMQEHPEVTAILCGGQGSNEPCPEAEAMYDYMVDKGMDADRLLLEDKSSNTIQNIENARALIGDGHKTAVVTSDYHLARARVLMERGGLDACGIPAPTPYPAQRVSVHCREYCSILGLMLTGRWA
ncbi:MAG TPA: YdcF family protein [Candidatus Agathobaculum merdigallinarum]|nr:YdcF family protein [Candidatus Agathobaculum merdigallinarum]